MTYWVLLVLALALSWGSLKYRHLLFSLASVIGWIALWRYNLTYPPTNIIAGDITHEWLTYIYIILALAMIFMWLANRNRGYTGYSRSAKEEQEYQKVAKETNQKPHSLMSQSSDEYRATVRKALRSGRRRR
ncbi:hypothetical protein LCGC14_1820660 [marine sediment metagenome]|uniref:Uncharacterized protein n=1 Tax=marine sediment metagenome TaxID=412755 RepID=A0A0F9JIM6_9ZZZZ